MVEEKDSVRFTISVIGLISKTRGVFEIVESIRILVTKGYSNLKVYFVGLFDTPYLQNHLLDLVKYYTLDDHVFFIKQVPYPEVFKILNRSDLGLAILHPEPNYLESIPTKIFEYYLAGLPVISSDFKYWNKIVIKYQCGYVVDPFNIESIVHAIEKIINNPSTGKRMGNNGKKLVNNKYNWENEEKKLLSLYQTALGINNSETFVK